MHRLLRRAQVAERYGIDERTVDRWKLDGRLPSPHYRGRLPLWREDELEQLDRKAVVASRARPVAATP
jgi:predicted DNA-binding transcriptional regulator AlpA